MINLLIMVVELEPLFCTVGLWRKEVVVHCRANGTSALVIEADFSHADIRLQ